MRKITKPKKVKVGIKKATLPRRATKASGFLAKQGVTGKPMGKVREKTPTFNEGF